MEDINPVKPPIGLQVLPDSLINWFWAFLVVILILLIYFIFRYFHKKIKKENPAPNEQVNLEKIDFKEQAVKKLNQAKKLIDEGKYKKFHLEVTVIIKEYLSGRFAVNFTDMTSREVLVHNKISGSYKVKIEEFLVCADLAKFAGNSSKKEYAIKALALAEKIIL